MRNAPHGYLWGPAGEVIIMTSHDDTLQEEVIGQILEVTKILGDFV